MNRSTTVGRWFDNGRAIRSARRRKGWSQEHFATVIGTTRRHMIRLENGEHLPQADLRNRIADTTGVPRESIESSDDEEDSALPIDLAEALKTFARYTGNGS